MWNKIIPRLQGRLRNVYQLQYVACSRRSVSSTPYYPKLWKQCIPDPKEIQFRREESSYKDNIIRKMRFSEREGQVPRVVE
jgi:hypothetical protein